MPITFTIANDNVDDMLADLRRMFPTLTTGSPLPPMQEQPLENREPQPANDEKPKERKPRAKKEAASAEGEPASAEGAASSTGAANTSAPENASENASTSASEIPDIEDVRAKLKALGGTDGFGTDKVFEVLGRYKATNASTVPEARRAELIAEIDALLKEGPK